MAASKWLKKIMNDEKTQGFPAQHNILQQLNLARAPWWGGQFERLIGVVKQAFYKAIDWAKLTLSELEEVILDVEVLVNNISLTNVEDDVELPVLTPNLRLYGQANILLEEVDSEQNANLKKRTRYLCRCGQGGPKNTQGV